MARKKKVQQAGTGEKDVRSSSPPCVQPARPVNQYQTRASKPISRPNEQIDLTIPLSDPPHPSNGPPSPELQEVINAYHYSIFQPHPSKMSHVSTMKSPLLEALTDVQEYGSGAVSRERLNDIMQSVHRVLGLEVAGGQGDIQRSSNIVRITEEKQNTENVASKDGGAPPVKENSWANLFKGSQFSSKGTSLNCIAPTIFEGKPVALLEQGEFDKMSVVWDHSIVLYVVGHMPSIGDIFRNIAKEWPHVSKPNVFLQDEGYFVVRFATVKDMESVLLAGPYSFFGKPMIVKPWSSNFDFKANILRVIRIKLPNFPLNCLG